MITGASGYIGERLVALALGRGHEVIAMSRRPVTATQWLPLDFESGAIATIPVDTDAVIHLAAATGTDQSHNAREIAAADALVAAARACGARFIFGSSQTARPDAPTAYGRTKWQIEQKVLAADGLVARLGQVYGGPEAGLFGTLVQLVRKLPLLPAFMPAPRVQPIHVDDCAIALLAMAGQRDLPAAVYGLAEPVPLSFTAFLAAIARHRVRARRIFVPVPRPLVSLLERILGEALSRRSGLQRLGSLFALPAMDTAPDLARIGVSLRPLAIGMERSGDGRRRALIREGAILLTYVLRHRPGPALIGRYVRAVESMRAPQALALADCVYRLPGAVALLEGGRFAVTADGAELRWRIDAATVIAEASPQGARRFMNVRTTGRLAAALAGMSWAVASEILVRLLRVIFPIRWLVGGYR